MKLLIYGIPAMPCPFFKFCRRLLPMASAVFLLVLVLGFHRAVGQPAMAGRPKGEGTPSPEGRPSPVGISPLSVGDTLPPATVQVSLPVPQTISLPQKGKLTLLYFWQTGCSGCWGKFPFLDSMRKKFGDRADIIVISPENQAKIDQLFAIVKKVKGTRLLSVSADTLLHQRFPHVMISHVAWIGQDGVVKAITAPDYITEANFSYLLAGNTPNWRVKADLVKYDGIQPLLSFNRAAGYNLLPVQPEYIFWCNSIIGLEGKLYRTPLPEGNRLTFINIGYRTLFSMALGGIPRHPNRYLVPDTLLPYFFKPDSMYVDDWRERYGTCLEMYFPGEANEALQDQKIKDALESRFQAIFATENLPVEVWEISGSGMPVTDNRETVKNRSYDWNYLSSVPIVFQPHTGVAGFKNAPLPNDLANFKSFSAWCTQNNLILTRENRQLSMFTIQPKK